MTGLAPSPLLPLPPLHPARLLRRYKRFLADAVLDDGTPITAHIANPGAMTGLAEPEQRIWLSHHTDPRRKLAWSWELSDTSTGLVHVHTGRANALAAAAIRAGQIPALTGYAQLRAEVADGAGSRIDLLLTEASRPTCYVEIKSVTLRVGTRACFPDAVTARGTRHLQALTRLVGLGHRAVLLFLIQRADCHDFAPAAWIDPVYSTALREAMQAGVEILCQSCHISLMGLTMGGALPLRLDPPLQAPLFRLDQKGSE